MIRFFLCTLVAASLGALAPADGWAGLVRINGSFASAALSATAPDGCRQSSVSFTAVDESTHAQPGRPAAAARIVVSHDVYDECTGESVFSAIDELALSPGAFEVSARNGTAQLRTAVQLVDAFSGRTTTLSIDVFWQAVASPWLDSTYRFRIREAGAFVLVLDSTTLSDAAILGSVSDGSTEYMNGNISAMLGETRYGVLFTPSHIALTSTDSGADVESSPTAAEHDASWAVAIWEAFDDSGCIRRLGIVTVEEAQIDRGDPVTSAYVDFSRWNHCTNEPEFWIGTDGSSPLPHGAFSVHPSFSGARLRADIDAPDRMAGVSARLRIDVAWNGTGTSIRSGSSSRSTLDGQHQTTHDAYRTRYAEIGGTVAASSGDLLAGYPIGPADLVSAAFGHGRTLTRTRP